jgi:hypothetical protein
MFHLLAPLAAASGCAEELLLALQAGSPTSKQDVDIKHDVGKVS